MKRAARKGNVMSKRQNYIRNLVRKLISEIEERIEDARERAGFHALEALESDNQDAREQREEALKLSARASAYVEMRDLLQEHCPPCEGEKRVWKVETFCHVEK